MANAVDKHGSSVPVAALPDGPMPALTGGTGSSRFVLVRDRDGRRMAVARHAVSAVGEIEDGGSFLVLPGGRTIVVDETLDLVMQWLG